jgi:hypothetical protein
MAVPYWKEHKADRMYFLAYNHLVPMLTFTRLFKPDGVDLPKAGATRPAEALDMYE